MLALKISGRLCVLGCTGIECAESYDLFELYVRGSHDAKVFSSFYIYEKVVIVFSGFYD